MSSNPVFAARSRLGVAARRKHPQQLQTARQELAAAKLEAHIAKILAEAPPLTPEQLDRIAVLLRPAGGAAK